MRSGGDAGAACEVTGRTVARGDNAVGRLARHPGVGHKRLRRGSPWVGAWWVGSGLALGGSRVGAWWIGRGLVLGAVWGVVCVPRCAARPWNRLTAAVTAATTELGKVQGHFHIYVNGEKQGRLYDTEGVVEMHEPGHHSVRVEVADSEHRLFTSGGDLIEDIAHIVIP